MSTFDDAARAEWNRRAKELNASGDGDVAWFRLRLT